MRYFFVIFGLCVIATMGILGKRGSHFRKPSLYIFPDMEWQLKLRPQKENSFFTNGLSSQLQIPGTIARSSPLQTVSGAVFPYEDAPVNTGRITGTTNFIENNPMSKYLHSFSLSLRERAGVRGNRACGHPVLQSAEELL